MNLPRLEWLLETSKRELQELELASLNRSQRAIKTARLEWEEALAQRSVAEVARWLIENREKLLMQASLTVDGQGVIPFPQPELLSSCAASPSDEGLCTDGKDVSLPMRRYSSR